MKTTKQLLLILTFLTLSQWAMAATFTVTKTTDDTPDGCTEGDCSLREAIIAANADTTADTIVFSVATDSVSGSAICLTRTGLNEDAASTGDLDITQSVTITGNGANKTIIDGGHRPSVDDPDTTCSSQLDDRIFHITSAATTVTITGVTVEGGNVTDIDGGGISNNASNLIIENSYIQYNSVTTTTISRGGGIYSSRNFILRNSRVTHNLIQGTGRAYGAGLYFIGITNDYSINDSEVSFNKINVTGSSSSNGAGVFFLGSSGSSSLTITNSSIVDNTFGATQNGYGGGFYGEASLGAFSLNIVNSTIAGNSATKQGGGFLFNNFSTFNFNLLNTIIADNTATTGSDCVNNSATITSFGYNIIENNCGITLVAGDLIGDPGLLPLADNGGDTYTKAFSADSIALNAGTCTNSLNSEDISLDQRGVTRADGCDIGAFERISFFSDVDADGYGGPTSIYFYDNGLTEQSDCDDTNPDISPADTEICDSLNTDEDCDGLADDADSSVDTSTFSTFYADADGDTFGDVNTPHQQCDADSSYVLLSTDNDDTDNTIYPDAPELCDGKDNDQDTSTDETFTTKGDACTVGVGACEATGELVCNNAQDGVACNATAGTSSDEICTDNIDNDCDGDTDADDSDCAASSTGDDKPATTSGSSGCSLIGRGDRPVAPTDAAIFFLLFAQVALLAKWKKRVIF